MTQYNSPFQAPAYRAAVCQGSAGREGARLRHWQGTRWQCPVAGFGGGWPAALGPWLLDSGSLTAKLKQRSAGQFGVEVLSQRLAMPTLDERHRLGLKPRRWALVREVVLCGQGQPWVFARSLVPLTDMTGRFRQLQWLDSRPLGSFLFRQPDLEREPLEVARLTPAQAYVPAKLQQGQTLWARRSVFRLDRRALLVGEVFLPAFLSELNIQRN